MTKQEIEQEDNILKLLLGLKIKDTNLSDKYYEIHAIMKGALNGAVFIGVKSPEALGNGPLLSYINDSAFEVITYNCQTTEQLYWWRLFYRDLKKIKGPITFDSLFEIIDENLVWENSFSFTHLLEIKTIEKEIGL